MVRLIPSRAARGPLARCVRATTADPTRVPHSPPRRRRGRSAIFAARASAAIVGPMPQPGAVSVIFTLTRLPLFFIGNLQAVDETEVHDVHWESPGRSSCAVAPKPSPPRTAHPPPSRSRCHRLPQRIAIFSRDAEKPRTVPDMHRERTPPSACVMMTAVSAAQQSIVSPKGICHHLDLPASAR